MESLEKGVRFKNILVNFDYFLFQCNAHGLIPLNGLSVNRFTRSESPRGYIPRVVIIDIEYILYIYGRYAACIRFGSALGAVYTITPAPRLTETLGAVYTITLVPRLTETPGEFRKQPQYFCVRASQIN